MRIGLAVALCAALAVGASATLGATPRPIVRVAVIADPAADAPARHGLEKLEEAIRARGLTVSEGSATGADLVIVAGLGGGGGPAAGLLAASKAPAPQGAEALTVRIGLQYQGKPAILLAGSDGSGVMYAALDLAQRVDWAPNAANVFGQARNAAQTPSLKNRAVIIYTMNRAYFESRLHDANYWTSYFDMLAADRINEMVLTFGYENGGYMAPPYPYFFNVDGFPDVRVVGLTPAQQQANFDGLKTMLRLAAQRGIRIKPAIWDHIYRGGTQRGGIDWASDGKSPSPGVVWGINGDNLVPYTEAALKKFYSVFPEMGETQFRMHNESGLLDSEINGFWDQIFAFYQANEKTVPLELRVKGLDKSVIADAQSRGLDIHLDTKVWMEQMGLPYHPTHINSEDQDNARHSYADLLEYPQTYLVNWSLWNGGSQRILQWSDPDYARRMAINARLYNGDSLSVTEMEGTKMLGAPLDMPARDFVSPQYKSSDYEFERYWAFYRVWGRMTYDPTDNPDSWVMDYNHRFGAQAGPHVEKAVELASTVLPRIVAASLPYSEFPTSTGWPEMKHEGSLPQFARTQEGGDIAQFENARQEAALILSHDDTAMRRPQETARWFASTSNAILAEVAAATRAQGAAPPSKEFQTSLTDARILAALARYHGQRLLAAVDYNLYKQAGSLPAFDAAIGYERSAIADWRDLVAAAGDVYADDMWFGAASRFPHHWKDELPTMDKEFAQLLAERQAAPPSASTVVAPVNVNTGPLPVVSFLPSAAAIAQPGQDFLVRARVTTMPGVKWIRLRYRHVNQKEDYLTAPMTRAADGTYSASIPGAFVDPHWDLMYYVEVMDTNGDGRIYPDLETTTPYLVQAVKH